MGFGCKRLVATVDLVAEPYFGETLLMRILLRRYSTLALLSFALVGCRRHTSVIDSVTQQLRNGAIQVDIGNSADSSWDEMFVFAPYSPMDEICRTLKLSGSQCSSAGIKGVDEGEFLLVFTQHGVVSETLSFPRTIADFDESERCSAKAIAKDISVFAVQRRDNRVYLVCRL
jgi:hypothetical protein